VTAGKPLEFIPMGNDATAVRRLNSIDVIRRLNVVARKYYHNEDVSFNHESYIRECFECLLSFFSTELYVGEGEERENAYLFAALTYKKEDNPNIELVKVVDGFGYYFAQEVEDDLEDSFNRIMDELYQAIYEGRSMSVTKALLRDKRRGKDLFLYSGQPYEEPVKPSNPPADARIAFFPLSKLDFSPSYSVEFFCDLNKIPISDFRESLDINSEMRLEDNDRQIGTLLWYYKRLEREYCARRQGREFLVHFIRPSFIEFGHNILLSLGTSRRLHVDQLSLIYLLVYRIVSQTVIEKIKQDRQEKSSYYAFGIGHFLKHRISPVVSHLVGANKLLTNDYKIGGELQSSIILAQTALGSASVLDLFGKALAKRTAEPGYTEFSEKTIKKLVNNEGNAPSSFGKYRLNQEPINVRDLILEVRDLIKREWHKDIEIQFDGARDWADVIIDRYIKFKDRWGRDISFCPEKAIYQQFLHELLRNISKSEHPKQKTVEIRYEISEEEDAVIISRAVPDGDAHNLQALGIGYDKYSTTKGGLSGLTLIEH
jgi:hypothetical protein